MIFMLMSQLGVEVGMIVIYLIFFRVLHVACSLYFVELLEVDLYRISENAVLGMGNLPLV